MNLEGLQAACVILKTSSKVTERKKAAESILELITDNEEICRILDYNSVHKGDKDKLTWTSLFIYVKDYFAKETEKLTNRDVSKCNMSKAFYLSVVDRVLQKGTCRRPWIQWRCILDFLFNHLIHDVHATIYGSNLLSMLQNFLSIDLYASIIDANAWIELIKLLLKVFGKYEIPPFMVLQCLNIAIQEGSNHPTVIATLRTDVVRFFENMFTLERNKLRPHVVLCLRGVTALCRKNASEFRGILCKLGESIIPNVLHCSTYVAEEEGAIIELLLVQLQLHSPCDVSNKNPAFYAHDTKKWTEILKNIYAFCLDTIEEVANKRQSYYNKDLNASDRLILLAAKCTKQIYDGQLDENSSSGDEDEPNPSKKAMRYRSFNNVLSDVCSRMQPGENQIVWMTYLTAVLTEFPNLVGSRMNYSSLVTMGLSFLNSSFVSRREIYLFFLCLLNTEKYLIETDQIKSRSKSWETVWDVTLRSLSMNESKTEAMELLRSLLIEVQPSNVNALLLLYVQGSTPLSPASLYLLSEYLSRATLPLYIGSSGSDSFAFTSNARIGTEFAATTCPRYGLIRWIISQAQSVEESQMELGHEPLISTILASLLVRQTHNLIHSEKFCFRLNTKPRIPSELSQYRINHDDFEKLALKCNFIQLPSDQRGELNMATEEVDEILQLSLMPLVPSRLVESLNEDFERLPTFQHSALDFMSKFTQLNYRVGVYLNLLNVLEKHSIGSSGGGGDSLGFRTSLEKLFDKAFTRCMDAAMDFITKGKDKTASEVQEVILSLRNILKSTHLCDKVKSVLAQRFPQQMQELLKKVYRSNLARFIEKAVNNSTASDAIMFGSGQESIQRIQYSSNSGGSGGDESPGVSDNRQIELAALEALGCLLDYGMLCDHRTEIFRDLLADAIYEAYTSAILFNFDFAAELISRLIPVLNSNQTAHSELINTIITLLQKMCKGFYQLPHCTARLWELFADIASLIAQDTEASRKNLMSLVGTLTGFLRSGLGNGNSLVVSQAGFRTLGELAKYDPNMAWTYFNPKSGPSCWVLGDIYEFLNNPSHQIRLFDAETIALMYQHAAPPTQGYSFDTPDAFGPPPTIPTDKRLEYYEKTYQFLQKTFSIAASFSADEKAEEGVNRTSVALYLLSRLIFAYPFIQKKSLFSLLQLIKLKGIDVQMTNRALNYASSSASKTMSCHVSFLLCKWFSSKYSIEEFPYPFFGCESLGEFYTKFRKEISREFFQMNNDEGLKKLAAYFNIETIELIKECYGMLMARIVPGMSVYKAKGLPPPKDLVQLQETQKHLSAALGGKHQTEELMMTSLGDVVLQLVSLVFDPLIPSAWGCSSMIRLPEPSPPFYDEESVDISINFLKEASIYKDVSIIAFLAKNSPKSIYDNLLTLISRVHNAHDALEKFWRLHQFSYFVRQLQQEPSVIFNLMKEYVCQFVVYAYLRLLNEVDSEAVGDIYSIYLRQALIYLISQLVLTLTLSYKEEMKNYYHPVVNGLISVVVKHPDLIDAVRKPLDLLLKTYKDEFTDCIISLAPFPNDIPAFQDYREIYLKLKYGFGKRAEWPLQKELKSCLNEIESSNGSCTKERLEFLRELLSKRKRDLEKIVRSLEGKRFSDECSDDTLHCIIKMLLDVIKNAGSKSRGVKNSSAETLALEASRCLGEIGPVDLSIMVLPSCYNKNSGSGEKAVNSIPTVIQLLIEYLKSDDIIVVTTCGEVLRSMCEVKECSEQIGQVFGGTRIEGLLKPFRDPELELTNGIKTIEKVFANQLETKLGLNEMNEFVDFSTWLTQLTCGLIECFKFEDSLMAKLLPICKLKVDFCQQILPFVFHILLSTGRSNPLVRKTISGYFRNFFNKFVQNQSNIFESSRSFTPVIGNQSQISIYLNKLALRSLLSVIQFLRYHDAPQEFKGSNRLTPWDNNFWLDVNYLELAKAAQYCGAYLTSILFTEIAASDLDMGGASHNIDELMEEDPIDSFYSQGTALFPRNRGDTFEKLLLKAYTSIGEPDAVYGCGSARFSDPMMNIRHLQQRMQWNRVLSACDGNAADSDSSLESGVCTSMKELGLYNTLWTYLQGIETREKVLDPDLASIQYECGWRLSKWNLHCDKATYVKDGGGISSSSSMLHRFIYSSVQMGLEGDVVNHLENIRRGYKNIGKDFRHASVESSENLLGFLSDFQMVRIVEDFFQQSEVEYSPTSSTPGLGGVDEFLHKWKTYDRISTGDFKFQEPILYLRSVLLRSYDQKHPRADLEQAYDDGMLELLARARDTGRLEFAENCAACISSSNSDKTLRKDLEIAKNNWARGDQDIARHILGKLLKKSSPEGCDLYPVMLLLYGEWLSETMSERPSVILEKYLLRSCQIYEKRKDASASETSKAHFVLAKYADVQYQNVIKYMKSDLFSEKKENIDKAKTDIETLRRMSGQEAKRSASNLQKQTYIDEEEIKTTVEEKKKFLLLALRHYLRALKDSNDQDLLIFRAVALWLDNSDSDDPNFSKQVNFLFQNEGILSYKYIVVLHQLSARMNGNSAGLTEILTRILTSCANEHPYQTLPVLLTQALLNKDQETGKSSNRKQLLADRVKAASKLVEDLKKEKKNQLGALVSKMEQLWIALITFANISNPEDRNTTSGGIPISSKNAILTLKGLESVAVPTFSVPISQSMDYKDIVIGIKSFDNFYNLVGGINSPKRISCIGTNGVKFNMLLKGQDDLRQDAVMQQVFGVMNKLLNAETKTKTRRLQVRTYKVVPLSQRTGILEWCENTQTFGDYLVNTERGAHIKYRPSDYQPMECRKKMIEVKDCGDNDKKYGNFMTILEHFKPVFRHFFFENFTEAGTFFERRLAYTRSVATNSMVGYILGLGDRHVLNILIDKTTAELIHIDLGVAFEQGRILPTPETIPFRLTRDIVDGMGVSGVEGVFRKSCEMTLDVLRNNADIILTILEVLLYDPLYMWALTADRVKKVQPMENSRSLTRKSTNGASVNAIPESATNDQEPKARNSSAARVLLRLKQKLVGIEEEGCAGSALSVAGHVSLLIQRAMDPERLSRLFPGWQPYL